MPPPYPKDLERAVRLANDALVWLRPIRPDDAPRLIALYGRLSTRSAYQRFFTVMKRLPPDWAQVFATVDFQRRLAIVAERETPMGSELIGVGRYEPGDADDTVEVAFVVEDGWQGFGLGPILLDAVLRAGEARGIQRFRAYVLGQLPHAEAARPPHRRGRPAARGWGGSPSVSSPPCSVHCLKRGHCVPLALLMRQA